MLVIDFDQWGVICVIINFWCDNFFFGWVGCYLFKYFWQVGLIDIVVDFIIICLIEFELVDKILDLFWMVEKISEQGIIS